MPESPRWLCNKDRHEEALAVFSHWHGEGNVDDEFVQLEYSEVRAAIEFDKEQGKPLLLHLPQHTTKTLTPPQARIPGPTSSGQKETASASSSSLQLAFSANGVVMVSYHIT